MRKLSLAEISRIRKRAAQKSARTRATNQAWAKRWREVEEPAQRRTTRLFNWMLSKIPSVRLRWNPITDTGKKLMHEATEGELVRVLNGGRVWRVLPTGYKRPQDYHAAYWQLLGGQ